MLNEITTKEIMTTREAVKKYRTQYFVMVITKVVDHCDHDLGYVIYTADSEKELTQISRDRYKDKQVAFLFGDGTEPCPQLGNVVYHEHEAD